MNKQRRAFGTLDRNQMVPLPTPNKTTKPAPRTETPHRRGGKTKETFDRAKASPRRSHTKSRQDLKSPKDAVASETKTPRISNCTDGTNNRAVRDAQKLPLIEIRHLRKGSNFSNYSQELLLQQQREGQVRKPTQQHSRQIHNSRHNNTVRVRENVTSFVLTSRDESSSMELASSDSRSQPLGRSTKPHYSASAGFASLCDGSMIERHKVSAPSRKRAILSLSPPLGGASKFEKKRSSFIENKQAGIAACQDYLPLDDNKTIPFLGLAGWKKYYKSPELEHSAVVPHLFSRADIQRWKDAKPDNPEVFVAVNAGSIRQSTKLGALTGMEVLVEHRTQTGPDIDDEELTVASPVKVGPFEKKRYYNVHPLEYLPEDDEEDTGDEEAQAEANGDTVSVGDDNDDREGIEIKRRAALWTVPDDDYSHTSKTFSFHSSGTTWYHPALPPGWDMKISDDGRPLYIHPEGGSTIYCPVPLPVKTRSRPTRPLAAGSRKEDFSHPNSKRSMVCKKNTNATGKSNTANNENLLIPSGRNVHNQQNGIKNRYTSKAVFPNGEHPTEPPLPSKMTVQAKRSEGADVPEMRNREVKQMQSDSNDDEDTLKTPLFGAKERPEGLKLPSRQYLAGLQNKNNGILQSPTSSTKAVRPEGLNLPKKPYHGDHQSDDILLKSPLSSTLRERPECLKLPSSLQRQPTFDSAFGSGGSTGGDTLTLLKSNLDQVRSFEDMELVSSDAESFLISRSSSVCAESNSSEKRTFVGNMCAAEFQGKVATSKDDTTESLDLLEMKTKTLPQRKRIICNNITAKASENSRDVLAKLPEEQESPENFGCGEEGNDNDLSAGKSSSPKENSCLEGKLVNISKKSGLLDGSPYRSPRRNDLQEGGKAAGLSPGRRMLYSDGEKEKGSIVGRQLRSTSSDITVSDGMSKASSKKTGESPDKAAMNSWPATGDTRGVGDKEESLTKNVEHIYVTAIAHAGSNKQSSPAITSRSLQAPLHAEFSPGLPSVNLDESAFPLDDDDDDNEEGDDTRTCIGDGAPKVSPSSQERVKQKSRARFESVDTADTSLATFLMDSPGSSSSSVSSRRRLRQHSLESVPSFPWKGSYDYHFRAHGRFEETTKTSKKRMKGCQAQTP